MKKYEHPELEINKIFEDVITASEQNIVDRGFDLPGIPILIE